MRTITPLTDGWQYAVCEPLNDTAALPVCCDWQPVALPHVWNRDIPSEAGPRAYRCTLPLAPRPGRALFFWPVPGAAQGRIFSLLLGCVRRGPPG